jgi:hypothetical protein
LKTCNMRILGRLTVAASLAPMVTPPEVQFARANSMFDCPEQRKTSREGCWRERPVIRPDHRQAKARIGQVMVERVTAQEPEKSPAEVMVCPLNETVTGS